MPKKPGLWPRLAASARKFYAAAASVAIVLLCVSAFFIFTDFGGRAAEVAAGVAFVLASALIIICLAVGYILHIHITKLTDSLADTEASAEELYGIERRGQIGILSRAVNHMRVSLNETNASYIELIQQREHQEFLMETVDEITFSLLSMPDNDLEQFDNYLIRGIMTVSICGEVDAISVYRNEIDGDKMAYVPQFAWVDGRPKAMEQTDEIYSYKKIPSRYEKLANGEFLNAPVAELTDGEREAFRTDAEAILVIPVYFQERFWGIVCYEDRNIPEPFDSKRVVLLKSAALMIVSAVHRKRQASRIREATERMEVMLDAMPIGCHIWDSDMNMIDANKTSVRFFNFKTREELFRRFNDASPEFQPDGQRSKEIALEYHRRALQEGECHFEWTYRVPDTGELIPCEVTLVRMKFEGKYVVAGYLRDVREHRQMIQEIEIRGHLLQTVNSAANILLQSEIDEFESALFRSLSMMARVVDVERVFVWEYKKHDGERHFSQIYEWIGDTTIFQRQSLRIDYPEDSLGFEARLLRGLCIIGNSKDLPAETRASLQLGSTQSHLMIPVFLRGKLWGLVGFGDMRRERDFTESEESILRSGGLLVANALLRNEMTQSIKATATKLQAVISNFSGIIWSADAEENITLFNGLAMNKLGIQPNFYEGKHLDAIPANVPTFDIAENARKTFSGGSRRWSIKVKDDVFSARTAPVIDTNGNISDVVGSIDDITESVRLQERLEKALSEAWSASQAKSNFLSSMSHEMRTPMNAIIGMTTLGRDAESIERKDYAFNKIEAASHHLLGVINDVLDMSKIEAGMLVLSDEPFNLERTINAVISVTNFRIEEKSQRLILEIDPNIPNTIVADDHRLAQVLTNLISNAVKFTPEYKEIRLVASLLEKGESECAIRFDVIDQGIGLSPEQQSVLFQSFVQAEASITRKYGGTGLGLAISKRIVELMGGEIWIESNLGQGATFSFTIKVALPNEKAARPKRVLEQSEPENLIFTGRRLLLAEDVDINREIILAMLEDSEIEIVCAENGLEALQVFSQDPERFDLVFMDVQMPIMDGYEATRKIRSIRHPAALSVPIIAMTANVFREDIEKCLEAGMNGHLGKPLDFDVVRETLVRYLG